MLTNRLTHNRAANHLTWAGSLHTIVAVGLQMDTVPSHSQCFARVGLGLEPGMADPQQWRLLSRSHIHIGHLKQIEANIYTVCVCVCVRVYI